MVRELKTVFSVEAVMQYCLLSDNGKAPEKYIPVNYGFLFSANKLWRPICEISALPAVALGPSWRMPRLVRAVRQPCLLHKRWVGVRATSPCLLLLQPRRYWCLPTGFVCLKSCRRFLFLIPLAGYLSGAGKENRLVLPFDCGSQGLLAEFLPTVTSRLLLRETFFSRLFFFPKPCVTGEAKLNRHDGKKVWVPVRAWTPVSQHLARVTAATWAWGVCVPALTGCVLLTLVLRSTKDSLPLV